MATTRSHLIHGLWKSITTTAIAIMAGAVIFCTDLGAGIGSARATVITDGCAAANNSCTLEELLFGGASIQVNDKLFTGWVFLDEFGDIFPNFDNIVVSGLDDGGLDPGPGLKYSFNGELTLINDNGEEEYFLAFGYEIEVLDPGMKIKDNTLTLIDYSISAAEGDGGAVFITEDAYDENFDYLFQPPFDFPKEVFVDNLDFLDSLLVDSRSFSPQSFIYVDTYIELLTDGVAGNVVALNMFEQRFSQTTLVPEPGTLALFGIGLAGLGFVRRRRVR